MAIRGIGGEPVPLTLGDLEAEFRRGRIYECSLQDPHWHLDGLKQGESVFIDPRPSIVLALLHELTHRKHPKWSERLVTKESSRLLCEMSAEDMVKWWRFYQRMKKKRRPKVVVD
jgi:hypothetical protein